VIIVIIIIIIIIDDAFTGVSVTTWFSAARTFDAQYLNVFSTPFVSRYMSLLNPVDMLMQPILCVMLSIRDFFLHMHSCQLAY